ncbi:hypothetical protein Taro_018186 [Colocasia esculenta]|uniref:Uncharacterized protein n=1 Tax=Colocasia esculenta TaxID=4460 RepID=A0A843UQ19_COLES|nr:hypothetical protein [Colocasia esculenta]
MIGGRAARSLFCSPSILAFFSSVSADASAPIHVLRHSLLRSAAAGAEEESAVPTARGGAVGVLHAWGCSDEEVALIMARQPSIARMDPGSLQSKLQVLRRVGLDGPDLVRIVSCRPRFLAGKIGNGLDARIDFLSTLFQSKGELLRAVSRNPSLLSYDVDRTMRPCVALYEEVGVERRDLGKVLLSRPTVICRSVLDDEKRELIRRTGLPHNAATYKYAVSVLAISHLETIREKLANLEKFGFSADQVLGLFGRTPNLLTLSVEKVQRNMTYVVGTMKLPATTILEQPFLVFANLETVLKPRFLVGGKLQEMGLEPQVKGRLLIRALRMTEERFLKHFVDCHERKVAQRLRAYYLGVKGVKRLAEASKSAAAHRRGFPF